MSVPVRGVFNARRFSGSAVLVLGSAFIANAFSYVFHFVLSRKLGPDAYGTLAALMAIGGMFGVLGSSVGTVAMQETARMWSSHLELRIPHFMRQTGLYVFGLALGIAVALMFASLLLGRYLHVIDVWLWLELAGWVALSLLAGYSRGAAQGAHRFWLFASSLLSEGVLRVVFAVLFVLMGFAVRGAIGGLACAALVGFFIVALPLLFGGDDASDDPEHVRLGGEALKILAVNMTAGALLFIDMLFAKHHFSGVDTGYFGAASTVAKTIPYGVGLIALVSMPSAAAARHTSRESLRHILRAVALLAIVGIAAALLLVSLFAKQLITITYGPHYTPAIALLPLYAIDEALLAGWAVASSYLVAIGQYRLFGYMLTAVVLEAVCMALFGSTPLRLLSIGIATNAALVPTIWMLALRSLK